MCGTVSRGSGGIGEASAQEFAAHGVTVVVSRVAGTPTRPRRGLVAIRRPLPLTQATLNPRMPCSISSGKTQRRIDVLVTGAGIGAGRNCGVDVRRNLQSGRGGGAFFANWLAVPPLGSGTLH